MFKELAMSQAKLQSMEAFAICAPITPYEEDRSINRKLISRYGGYVEIYVNTPLSICEKKRCKKVI